MFNLPAPIGDSELLVPENTHLFNLNSVNEERKEEEDAERKGERRLRNTEAATSLVIRPLSILGTSQNALMRADV